jgi:hypothetical protein
MTEENDKIFTDLINKLKKEYNELNIKMNNLDIWIQLHEDNINKEYIGLMKEQLDIMVEYGEVLYQRIKYLIKTYK